jgi:excinuclease ABC subunit A
MAEVTSLRGDQAAEFFADLRLGPRESAIAREPLRQIGDRLGYLDRVGLGYLQLDRTLRTLSGGETQRVALTGALGSSLVNMLYVLDEPTAGLHPHDVDKLRDSILALRDRGNTVVVVEHEEGIMRVADELIEIGPGAGESGGHVVYQGDLAGMIAETRSVTGDFLAGRRGGSLAGRTPRKPSRFFTLQGASGHNLRDIDVDFPLGLLCLVTGVSGSGKSTLVQDTLYPAIQRRLNQAAPGPLAHRGLVGTSGIYQCEMIDQSPISRSPRSNPVTYVKAMDAIRTVFSQTVEARTRNFGPGHFSFNSELGRCATCEGDGQLTIDMQFLADVSMQCPTCRGTRYRDEILQVRYRDRSIADVLSMSVRAAFAFFRGHDKVREKLQRLIDVGLEYVALGQSATTLSSGEAQRLKLAAFLAAASRRPTLFILDEPTTGLHMADVVRLYDCFDALIADGHSLIVVEHNLQLIRAADYIIDLGPGAADEGGLVVATGTPEEVARIADSRTGQRITVD